MVKHLKHTLTTLVSARRHLVADGSGQYSLPAMDQSQSEVASKGQGSRLTFSLLLHPVVLPGGRRNGRGLPGKGLTSPASQTVHDSCQEASAF